ncbi:baseplate multidomain protein megatron [Donghicola tyrosinivorans]|uniref:Putative tail protein n=1 Tax=Donghicola tyrosinivorans TaxID=1652492 RepID=A0A2T0WTW7_9RHOB|nr:glycoside hydrolase TIM-barrel-like domain-containing protein [Donghicola tyrosinivorans]PRY90143.1 putative tail protein [Donghicola tyrosinivorans]
MATIILSAVGGTIGNAIGGSVLGLSTGAIGRAAGAMIGQALDRRVFAQSYSASEQVEVGRVDRLRLGSSSEGAPMARVYGRTAIGGQVIWASQFKETVHTRTSVTTQGTGSSGGGKGTRRQSSGSVKSQTTTHEYTYSISLAIALCEGEIARVARVWADGTEVDQSTLNMRVYRGDYSQSPDALIEAIEGAGSVPAYRGTAYVVIEDLQLKAYGNRVPSFSFEVVRPAPAEVRGAGDIARDVGAVALIPGTGEYSLATTPVHYGAGNGRSLSANVNSYSGRSDLATSTLALVQEAPDCKAVSLVVSWFGNDLRCGECRIRPVVEQKNHEGSVPWQVAGLNRASAGAVPLLDGNPVYGGTPSDASIIEAIQHLKARGQEVMFYPFILMEQLAGNSLPDPWGDGEQAALPWRGRISLSVAPDRVGSPDQTAAADAEVAAFFGNASLGDFAISGSDVVYSGPEEWSLRRMTLHYANLCKAAGGVDAFCIGSELRGLTQIRGAAGFPAVEALRQLARDVRTVLGPDTRISYAADWSEYFGYQPQDGSGDSYFHLDSLWADEAIDFIGIDNYMPLADWREGTDHLDASWGSLYDLGYLKANIEGGEGYDWYYPSSAARDAQKRQKITDDQHGEPWVWRNKDIRGWWSNLHHERIGGTRQEQPTDWQPFSKPIVFTEIGCAAIDKGPNQPNKFIDTKSSESALPHYSSGQRDEFAQMQYLRAMRDYWSDAANNPTSPVYDGPMLDADRMFIWAWDARPYPAFPNCGELWSDAENYKRGHWLNGRTGHRALASVVAEICASAGVTDIDVSQLYGVVRGYHEDARQSARAALQALMMTHGFDALERDGTLVFRTRLERSAISLSASEVLEDEAGDIHAARLPVQELPDSIQLGFVEADADFEVGAVQSVVSGYGAENPSDNEVPVVLTRAEARQVADRWLSEARVARETLKFSLPPSQGDIGPGDLVSIDQRPGEVYRIDRRTVAEGQTLEAVRVEPTLYRTGPETEQQRFSQPYVPPLPVETLYLDLPLTRGDEIPDAPHVASAGDPWPGGVAIYSSVFDAGYSLAGTLGAQATMGVLETDLPAAPAAVLQRDVALEVTLIAGTLASVEPEALLAGANAAAIGDGSPDGWEVIQFQKAELIAPQRYRLEGLLRGQLGSDRGQPLAWDAGSHFVLLDGALEQLNLPVQRDQLVHLRAGPVGRSYDHSSYSHDQLSFSARGLCPLSPCHLRWLPQANADHALSWIRRTRIGGDAWGRDDVPLAEQREAYRLTVVVDGQTVRSQDLTDPSFQYTAQMRDADGATDGYRFEVAQLSDLYGAGDAASLLVQP